jgi:hypothetical protein
VHKFCRLGRSYETQHLYICWVTLREGYAYAFALPNLRPMQHFSLATLLQGYCWRIGGQTPQPEGEIVPSWNRAINQNRKRRDRLQ